MLGQLEQVADVELKVTGELKTKNEFNNRFLHTEIHKALLSHNFPTLNTRQKCPVFQDSGDPKTRPISFSNGRT